MSGIHFHYNISTETNVSSRHHSQTFCCRCLGDNWQPPSFVIAVCKLPLCLGCKVSLFVSANSSSVLCKICSSQAPTHEKFKMTRLTFCTWIRSPVAVFVST